MAFSMRAAAAASAAATPTKRGGTPKSGSGTPKAASSEGKSDKPEAGVDWGTPTDAGEWDYMTIYKRTKSHAETRKLMRQRVDDDRLGDSIAATRDYNIMMQDQAAKKAYKRLGTQTAATNPRNMLVAPPNALKQLREAGEADHYKAHVLGTGPAPGSAAPGSVRMGVKPPPSPPKRPATTNIVLHTVREEASASRLGSRAGGGRRGIAKQFKFRDGDEGASFGSGLSPLKPTGAALARYHKVRADARAKHLASPLKITDTPASTPALGAESSGTSYVPGSPITSPSATNTSGFFTAVEGPASRIGDVASSGSVGGREYSATDSDAPALSTALSMPLARRGSSKSTRTGSRRQRASARSTKLPGADGEVGQQALALVVREGSGAPGSRSSAALSKFQLSRRHSARTVARIERAQEHMDTHVAAVRDAMRLSFKTGSLNMYLKGLRPESLGFLGSSLFLQTGHLEQVNLQGNQLESMPPEVWQVAQSASSIRLSANRFKVIDPMCHTWTHVTELDMSDNRLVDIGPEVCNLTTLRKLNLSSNLIRDLQPPFGSNLPALVDLDLMANRIEFLPRDFALLSGVRRIDISRNDLRSLAILASVDLHWHVEQDYGPAKEWREVIHPLTNKPMFVNRVRGLMRERIPHADEMPDRFRLPRHQRAAGVDTLPDGWIMEFDLEKRHEIYVNQRTGTILDYRPTHPAHSKFQIDLTALEGGKGFSDGAAGGAEGGTDTGAAHDEDDGEDEEKRAEKERKEASAKAKLDFAERCARRRKLFARLQISEWVTDFDDDRQELSFYNLATEERVVKMPGPVDLVGNLTTLESLNVSRCRLLVLPDSIGRLVHLTELNACRNQIQALPAVMKTMTSLTSLDLHDNSIVEFPEMPASMRTMHLHQNPLVRMPEHMSSMVVLEELFLHRCKLTHLSAGMGVLTTLQRLRVSENPLEDPPARRCIDKPAAQVVWECRQIANRAKHGTPPGLVRTGVGAGGEIFAVNIVTDRDMEYAAKKAAETHVLNFPWRGLQRIDNFVIRVEGLRELRLPGNAITEIPNVVCNMVSLQTLLVSNNQITNLPKSLGTMKKLEYLVASTNKIKSMPTKIAGAVELQVLDLTGNLIEEIPRDIGELPKLQTMLLDNNQLKGFPPSIGRLRKLTTLSAGANDITALPNTLFDMRSLTSLNLNRNLLKRLPDSIGHIPKLKILRVGSNRIKELPVTFCNFELKGQLRELWVDGNRLKGLPQAFIKLRKLKVIRIDMNPMKSPPPAMALKGISALRGYFKERKRRIEKFTRLMALAGFETDVERLAPFAKRFVTGKTGYLTKKDLKGFDRQTDTYCNGEFYKHADVDPAALVDNFKKLKYERALSFYKLVLSKLSAVMARCERKKPLDETMYLKCYHHKFSKDEEFPTDVYAIRLDAMFGGQSNPNRRTIAERTGFPYSREITIEAARNYHLEDGTVVSGVAKVTYPECGCLDYKGRELRAKHEPCKQYSLVIKKNDYDKTEIAQRRNELKEVRLQRAFARDQVVQFLTTNQGMMDLKLKIVALKKQMKVDRRLHKHKVSDTRRELKTLRKELDRIVKCVKAYQMETRQKAPMFPDLDAAIDALELKEGDVMAVERTLQKQLEDLDQMNQRLDMNAYQWEEYAIDVLGKEKEDLAETAVYERLRRQAFENDLERPWDGEEGEKFKQWQRDNDLRHSSDDESVHRNDSSEFSAGHSEPESSEDEDVSEYSDSASPKSGKSGLSGRTSKSGGAESSSGTGLWAPAHRSVSGSGSGSASASASDAGMFSRPSTRGSDRGGGGAGEFKSEAGGAAAASDDDEELAKSVKNIVIEEETVEDEIEAEERQAAEAAAAKERAVDEAVGAADITEDEFADYRDAAKARREKLEAAKEKALGHFNRFKHRAKIVGDIANRKVFNPARQAAARASESKAGQMVSSGIGKAGRTVKNSAAYEKVALAKKRVAESKVGGAMAKGVTKLNRKLGVQKVTEEEREKEELDRMQAGQVDDDFETHQRRSSQVAALGLGPGVRSKTGTGGATEGGDGDVDGGERKARRGRRRGRGKGRGRRSGAVDGGAVDGSGGDGGGGDGAGGIGHGGDGGGGLGALMGAAAAAAGGDGASEGGSSAGGSSGDSDGGDGGGSSDGGMDGRSGLERDMADDGGAAAMGVLKANDDFNDDYYRTTSESDQEEEDEAQ